MIKVDNIVIEANQFPDHTLLVKAPTLRGHGEFCDIEWRYEDDSELFTLICPRKHYSQAEAQKQLIEAQARAEAAKKEADAKAYAGEKEAEANNKIKESITDDLLKYKEIEQWDGKYPTVVGGNSSVILPSDKLN